MSHPIEFLKRHSLISGIVLIFALPWTIMLAVAADSHGLLPFHVPPAIALCAGYGVVAASLIMQGLLYGKKGVRELLQRFILWRVGIRWYLLALFGFPAIKLAAVLLNAAVRREMPDFSHVFASQIFGSSASLWVFVLPFFLVDVLTNGEEIGWRGFVLPRLQTRYNSFVSSLILGVIWAVWHAPHFLVAGSTIPAGWFLLEVMAQTILFTWVYNNTGGSLLLVTLMHAAINTAGAFLPIAQALSGQYLFNVGLTWLVALLIVALAGPESLSRTAVEKVPVKLPVQDFVK
jgi:membrane protease YdiL (CAAX protease family)